MRSVHVPDACLVDLVLVWSAGEVVPSVPLAVKSLPRSERRLTLVEGRQSRREIIESLSVPRISVCCLFVLLI